MLMDSSSLAVLLLNLGGPGSLQDVKRFLYRLFDDPEIIRISFPPLRKCVAWLISTSRHKASQKLYAKIGGESPIRRLSEEQASELESRLAQEALPASVRAAFSCSNPFIEDVIRELASRGIRRFLLLPLFPQYSFTTTKGVLARARQAIERFAPEAEVREVRSFAAHPFFIRAHAELILDLLQSDGRLAQGRSLRPHPHLLFSAHSIPESLVTRWGDPYREEVNMSVQAILKELNWEGGWSLSWQSKLGPVKWLEPSTIEEVRRLGASGVKRLLVVPIAFVTDHLETLYELDQLMAAEARQAGIEIFLRVPGLNSHPAFIRCLADIVKGVTEGGNSV